MIPRILLTLAMAAILAGCAGMDNYSSPSTSTMDLNGDLPSDFPPYHHPSR